MATFRLGIERGRLYQSEDTSNEHGTVIFTDPDRRETPLTSFRSEDELLLLIEKYL